MRSEAGAWERERQILPNITGGNFSGASGETEARSEESDGIDWCAPSRSDSPAAVQARRLIATMRRATGRSIAACSARMVPGYELRRVHFPEERQRNVGGGED